MIKNIIFDFGDVFINLDKMVLVKAMAKHNVFEKTADLDALNKSFETGAITPEQFLDGILFSFPGVSKSELEHIWNAMLLDFPEYRLEFLETLVKERKYRLFLLSNTNAIHIPYFANKIGEERYTRFKNCFEGFYLSHEIHLRKPDPEIFAFVLDQNNLKANETLFIDDTEENTIAASTLHINTWNLKVGMEDVVDLKSKL